ncbi:MAG: PorT family protein [Candidatus Symbiothrix sp.]|jgi:hypothetical protein|nr:PorT family protein [Candidatus Symbiothrix sp.]
MMDNNSFDSLIREKIKDHALSPDEGCWNNIEQQLDAKPGKAVLWPWLSGIAVAATILIWFIFPFNKKVIQDETAEQLPDYEERFTENVLEEKSVHPLLPSDNKSKRIAQASGSKEETSKTPSPLEPDVVETKVPFPAGDAPEANGTMRKRERQAGFPGYPAEEPLPQGKPKKKTSLSLYFGSGGRLLAMNEKPAARNYSFGLRSGVISEKNPNYRIYSPEDFSEITHYTPVSFGLTFKKELNSTFALESGLVYTFLASKFKNSGPERDALLQLHYLGIPLNLHARIYGNRHQGWNVYFSAGGMLEKGILSHYSQNEYYSGSVINTTVNQNIKGLQGSLNVSFGIDYKLVKDFSIYLEPKIYYYLENTQPMSARTKNPLIIGINAGIRYNW